MAKRVSDNTTVVIGLGRFGLALALELMELGRDVLAIERDPELVRATSPYLTLVVEGDATSKATLLQLGVDQVQDAVVAIGSDLEASVLATAALSDIGVPVIWAKALSDQHADILKRVGATNVTLPEKEMGKRTAHYLAGSKSKEYIEFANGYAITMIDAFPSMVNRSVGDLHLFQRYGVSIIGLQRAGDADVVPVSGVSMVSAGDRLIVGGRKRQVEQFAFAA